jgi:hypothetical protein
MGVVEKGISRLYFSVWVIIGKKKKAGLVLHFLLKLPD